MSKSLGREFHTAGAEKLKLQFPNIYWRTPGISSWTDVENRREDLIHNCAFIQ